jgi:hypothetical protein
MTARSLCVGALLLLATPAVAAKQSGKARAELGAALKEYRSLFPNYVASLPGRLTIRARMKAGGQRGSLDAFKGNKFVGSKDVVVRDGKFLNTPDRWTLHGLRGPAALPGSIHRGSIPDLEQLEADARAAAKR